MTRRPSLPVLALVLLALAGPAWGQAAQPFDMTGDGSGSPAAPAAPAAPGRSYAPPMDLGGGNPAAPQPDGIPMMVPSIGPGSAAPLQDVPAVPAVPAIPAPQPAAAPAPASPSPASPPPAAAPAVAAAAEAPGAEAFRYIVPFPALRLAGENEQRSWTIFLTAREAAAPARLSVAYKNALVVMPEASRLRVLLNNQVALELPLASSDGFTTASADIPANALQPGANIVRFQAIQRHRTDCSIQSTYELWTDIDSEGTRLSFPGAARSDLAPQTLEDLPAVGYDAAGRTTIHIVTSRTEDTALATAIVKLSQALALFGRYPNPSVVVSEGKRDPDAIGTLTVVLGASGDINPLMSNPPDSSAQPVVGFVNEPSLGSVVLAVTGSGWGAVEAAVEAIAARVSRPLDVQRTAFDTSAWFYPDVHMFMGEGSITLDQLGVTTQQFSGRRFRVEFGVGIPSDFYADAYGEATLLLDAAYTAAVRPASHIDIYVNGQIAATTRIVSTSGGIYRHFPIQIPFRHFRPGVNQIVLEAVLETDADRACAPNGSATGPDRFVLFDTSAFSMPAFARVARLPDLAAFAGTGFPYNRQLSPSALVLVRSNERTVSAAATLMARLAMQSTRIAPFIAVSPANVGNRPAIFVGAASQVPPNVLGVLNISRDIATLWKADSGAAAATGTSMQPRLPTDPDAGNTDALFDQWREKLSDGGGWRGQVSGLEDWMKRTFDISFAALSLTPTSAAPFMPKPRNSLLLAQGLGPDNTAPWTLLTAPTDEQLEATTRSLVAVENWSSIRGQYAAYSRSTGAVETTEPVDVSFFQTRPFSIQNSRLIAANWLSNNITFYAICLISICIVLGIVTSALISRLGRPS